MTTSFDDSPTEPRAPQHSARTPRIALVLGSGGVRSAAAIGIAEVLNESGLRPGLVVGCSSGALFGALVAMQVEPAKANAAAYSLASVELADVLGKETKPEETGLSAPTVLTANTFDGLTYTLRLGALKGENYPATLAVAGEAKPEGKDAEERAKKLAERLPRERALATYTLLIPKSRLEDALKPRAELLARKEAPKDQDPAKETAKKAKAKKK